MTVCYFDLDDEITNAVSRVRVAHDALVTLVLPSGSRIATSRINFLILAREARSRGKTLAIVSGEAGVRALAVSAGLPAYPTVEGSEAALGSQALATAAAAPERSSVEASDEQAGGTVEEPPTSHASWDRERDATDRQAPAADGLWAAGVVTSTVLHEARDTDKGVDAARAATGGHLRKVMARPIERPARPEPDQADGAADGARAPGPRASASQPRVPRPPEHATPEHATPEHATPDRATPDPAAPDSRWRDEPWRDPRGRDTDTAPTTVMPVADARSIVPHSAVVDAGSTAGGGQTAARARAFEEGARRRATARRRISLLVRLTVVAAILAILGGGLYLYLPTAEITLTPRTQTAGPITLDVVADPAIRVVDAARARIPADVRQIPLSVNDEFTATGVAVSQARATGSVRFTSENTLFDVPVPAGTRVSAGGGIAFTTRREIILPKASFATGPTTRDVDIQAATAGPSGNVGAGAITRLPASLSQALVSVTNPGPTSGGRRTESKQIQKRDYDSAVRTLTARLDEALNTALLDPSTTPQGLTAYPETATVGEVRPDQAAGDLVGTRATSFTLTVSAVGEVLAVDRSLVEKLAADRLMAGVPQGFRLLDGTTKTTVGDPVVANGTIRYTAAAQALQWRPVEPSTIITAIRGRRIQEAKTTLEQFGSADVRHWPEFLDTMPSQDFRITVQVRDPATP